MKNDPVGMWLHKISAFIERSECMKCGAGPLRAIPSGHFKNIKLECRECMETVIEDPEDIFRQVSPEKFSDEREI